MSARTIRLIGPHQVDLAKQAIDRCERGWFVSISPPTRSLEQNSKLWPMLDDIRAQVLGMEEFSRDDIKMRFLNALGTEMRFLPELEGAGMFPVGLRSSKLTTEQFSGLIELLYEYGARHGVEWSEPNQEAA